MKTKEVISQAIEALYDLYDRADSWSVSGVYFSDECFTENNLALQKASDAMDALEDLLKDLK